MLTQDGKEIIYVFIAAILLAAIVSRMSIAPKGTWTFIKKKTLYRDSKPYLTRWTLLTTKWFSIKVHKTMMSDPADLHDHPWDYISFVLKGGYYELTSTGKFRNSVVVSYLKPMPILRATWYGPGSILVRKAHVPHKLRIPEGKTCWTLIITSFKKREWGFVGPNNKWVSHTEANQY